MQIKETNLPGVFIIKPNIHADARGYLYESFRADQYKQIMPGLAFVQENISFSTKSVLRGLHFQKTHPQGKLIQVLHGEIFDVAVDIRPNSSHFGNYFSIKIDALSNQLLWVPPGFAHGFCVLSETAKIQYKCTDYYQPDDEAGISWDCPHINIDWPIKAPIISSKDSQYKNLYEYLETS